ncbi:MAG: endolytic transglycosylase MltG [Clostridia bacterium]|nr:endolytic transglycosylase MltG [Clostridia bacterium]
MNKYFSSTGRSTALIIVIALVIALTLAFSLAACALNGTDKVADGTTFADQTSQMSNTAAELDASDTGDISEEPAGESTSSASQATEPATTVSPVDPVTTPTATTAPAPSPTTTSTPTSAAPVDASGSLPITNWTLTEQGTILWYTPAPAQIAYNAVRTVSVTIPEGYTLVEICKILEKKGIQTFYHTFSAALNGDYPSYGFTDASKTAPNRRYALEGYLFPDTYEFHVGEKPYNIFAKILSNTNAVLSNYQPHPGMTMDQVVTLASLIEEEAFTGETRGNVSSVLHNRLSIGQRLELDKSIHYVEWYIKPLIQSTSTSEINAYNSYYNTYKCPALPAGPISNPGRLAIEAAISPAQTNYYYFVTDAAGNYYYASTWEEHLENLKTAGLA